MSEPSSVLTEATAWTELTPPQRRTRWALLAFPLLGLAVVVVAFQWMVHRGASDEATRSEDQAAVAEAGPGRSRGSVPPEAALPESDSRPMGPRARSPAAQPPPPSTDENCIEAKRCEVRCKRGQCDLDCHRGTCELGVLEKTKLHCKGEGLCEVWCKGECEIECKDSPCRVHCAPGTRCHIGECRGSRRQCADNVKTCSASCD